MNVDTILSNLECSGFYTTDGKSAGLAAYKDAEGNNCYYYSVEHTKKAYSTILRQH